jgi:hypothetical protein
MPLRIIQNTRLRFTFGLTMIVMLPFVIMVQHRFGALRQRLDQENAALGSLSVGMAFEAYSAGHLARPAAVSLDSLLAARSARYDAERGDHLLTEHRAVILSARGDPRMWVLHYLPDRADTSLTCEQRGNDDGPNDWRCQRAGHTVAWRHSVLDGRRLIVTGFGAQVIQFDDPHTVVVHPSGPS